MTLVPFLAALALAQAAPALTTSTDSARDPNLPPSQDFSHIASTVDPVAGTWSVAYTFYAAPSKDAWGNLFAYLYTGASQCADHQALIADFTGGATLPGDHSVRGSVLPLPPPDRTLRAAESLTKTVDRNTITLTMVDSSLVGAAPTCVSGGIGHHGFLDTFGPLPFPAVPVPPGPGTTPGPAPLAIAIRSTRLTASRAGRVKVALKPFNQDAAGAVTLRRGGKLAARAAYTAKSGNAVTVSLKLDPATVRSLKRHRSLALTLTATAQAGAQLVTKSVRARVLS